MKNKTSIEALLLVLALALNAAVALVVVEPAQAQLYVDVQDPNTRMPIAVADFHPASQGAQGGDRPAGVIRNDLFLTGLFEIVNVEAMAPVGPKEEPDYEKWATTGAQALIVGSSAVNGNELVIEARLYDMAMKKMLMARRFSGRLTDARALAHRIADRALEKLTGVPGCFNTKIAFVDASRSREIYVMDFDGHNLQRVTNSGTLNMSPEWSPDGKSLLYTSFMRGKPDLWSLDLLTGRSGVVSNRPGLNASARYSPSGDAIAMTASIKGIPKIIIISPQGNTLKMLTSGSGNDISPTWSRDQTQIAYVSDQAGRPNIYVTPVNGGGTKRLTFNSNYNTDPDWSRQGDLLAYTCRVEGRFQICTIRADGTDKRVLTNEGSNQAPAWSPDGRMIAFCSNRDGNSRIYLMDKSGRIQTPISPIPGKSPAWSPVEGE